MANGFFGKLFSGPDLYIHDRPLTGKAFDLDTAIHAVANLGPASDAFIGGGAVQRALHNKLQNDGDIDIFCMTSEDVFRLSHDLRPTKVVDDNGAIVRLYFDQEYKRHIQLIRAYDMNPSNYMRQPTQYSMKGILKSFDISCCQVALKPNPTNSFNVIALSQKKLRAIIDHQTSINWRNVDLKGEDHNKVQIVTRYYKYVGQGYTFPSSDKKKIHQLMSQGFLPDLENSHNDS